MSSPFTPAEVYRILTCQAESYCSATSLCEVFRSKLQSILNFLRPNLNFLRLSSGCSLLKFSKMQSSIHHIIGLYALEMDTACWTSWFMLCTICSQFWRRNLKYLFSYFNLHNTISKLPIAKPCKDHGFCTSLSLLNLNCDSLQTLAKLGIEKHC